MRNRLLLLIIIVFGLLLSFGSAYSAWVFNESRSTSRVVNVDVPSWAFDADSDFAKISNLTSSTNLNVSKEQTLTQGSSEAIRLTSTSGTSTKDHIANVGFDRDYYLSEIRFFKFEFDYYHRYKREQYDKGLPTVSFLSGNSVLGTAQGGGDYCTDNSAFVATPIDDDWWHLEYYVFAHIPTFGNHNTDVAIPLTKSVNGVRINDRYMYDYAGTTAFTVIDNMRFSSEPAQRLGIFNRWTSDSAGKFFWFKVAFAGELHSCVLSSSDATIAVPEFDSTDTVSTSAPFPNGSPFYFSLLKAGKVTLTATLELGDDHEIFTISNSITVT